MKRSAFNKRYRRAMGNWRALGLGPPKILRKFPRLDKDKQAAPTNEEIDQLAALEAWRAKEDLRLDAKFNEWNAESIQRDLDNGHEQPRPLIARLGEYAGNK